MRRCFRNLLSVCHLHFIFPVLLFSSSAASLSLRREAPARLPACLPAFAILFSKSDAQVSSLFFSFLRHALAEAGKFQPVDVVTCVCDCVQDVSCVVLCCCVSAVGYFECRIEEAELL